MGLNKLFHVFALNNLAYGLQHVLSTPGDRFEIITFIFCFSLILLVILAQPLKPTLQRYTFTHKRCGYVKLEPWSCSKLGVWRIAEPLLAHSDLTRESTVCMGDRELDPQVSRSKRKKKKGRYGKEMVFSVYTSQTSLPNQVPFSLTEGAVCLPRGNFSLFPQW